MPYLNEFAHYKPLRRIAESGRVKSLLGRSRVRDRTHDVKSLPRVNISEVRPSQWQPDWVLAIDGSHAEVKVENGYPGAEVGYVTVASVLLDVAKVNQIDAQRPADPKEFRTTEKAESIDCALPGCNVVIDEEQSAKDSLRKALFEVFCNVRMATDGESLLDTYESLLKYKPTDAREQHCPYDDCGAPDGLYKRGNGIYQCSCGYKRTLYSTDALRIYEGMRPDSSNGAMFAEIMQVLERIWMVHILRTLEQKGWLSVLRRLAIVLDGPLAVFGHPAWLSKAIYQELSRINTAAKEVTGGQDLLLIGVEKSGAFVKHLSDIDLDGNGNLGAFPSQVAGLLSDDYIKSNIIFSDSTKPYGADTYFGRKFFYKTKSGALIVASLPFLNESHKDTSYAEPNQYPRLADAMGLLDQLVSSRYPNSLVPLISAHAEAAIPLNLGMRVLEKIAREIMGEDL